jgi:cytochrome b involved in lipid metabolism
MSRRRRYASDAAADACDGKADDEAAAGDADCGSVAGVGGIVGAKAPVSVAAALAAGQSRGRPRAGTRGDGEWLRRQRDGPCASTSASTSTSTDNSTPHSTGDATVAPSPPAPAPAPAPAPSALLATCPTAPITRGTIPSLASGDLFTAGVFYEPGGQVDKPRLLWSEDLTQNLFSWPEIAKHNAPDNCWLVVENKVHDVTSFLPQHPAGADTIVRCGGTTADRHYRFHPAYARELWDMYAIGYVAGTQPRSCSIM